MTGPVFRWEPDPGKLLEKPPEAIAPCFFEYLYNNRQAGPFARKNVFLDDAPARDYPADYHQAVSEKLMEAWRVLEDLGIIIHAPGVDEGWYIFSAAARKLGTAEALKKHIDEHFAEPSVRYAMLNRDLTEKLAQVEEQIGTKAQETIALIEEREQQARERIAKTARKVSVEEAQQQFNDAQRTHTTRIRWWGGFSVCSIVGFVIMAMLFGERPPSTSFGPPSTSSTQPSMQAGTSGPAIDHATIIYMAVIRVTVLTALAAIATFCLRVTRAHMHMREVNLHRQRIANSMAAFVESAATDEQADVIFGRMVDAVVQFGSSGLVRDGDDQVLPAKLVIDAITRSVRPKEG